MHDTPSSSGALRLRWAAIGAALAVTLGAGGLGIARATAPSGASAFVPIAPCRLADTRPGPDQVGPHTGPLGPDQAYTYDGWGDVDGACDLPTGSTALQLNVTATDATTLTNLRLYPTGTPTPTASNLNPAPGQPPTPNLVSVTLDGNGRFDVYNRFGSVHLVIDVAGYFTDHHHDDRYYTEAEVQALLAGHHHDGRYPTEADVLALLSAPVTMTYRPAGSNSTGGCPFAGATSLSLSPLPIGAEILDITAYVYAIPGGTYRMQIYKGTGTGDNGFAVIASTGSIDSGSGATASMTSHDVTPQTPETVDSGEQYWFHFEQQLNGGALCSVEVTYRPSIGS